MSAHDVFLKRLAKLQSRLESPARWLFVAHDQLSDRLGPLSQTRPGEVGIVLIESRWWAMRRPHHRQKLALVWANQRHFALEQARRGVPVVYEPTRRPFGDKLRDIAARLGPLQMMEGAEREMRVDVAPLVSDGVLGILPHDGWLTTPEDFESARSRSPHWFMDSFYKAVRRRTGILMSKGRPVGGSFSFDKENRKPWKGSPIPPVPPTFEPDDITREVIAMIESEYDQHPGELDPNSLPATADDAIMLWDWAKNEVMEHFGPFEDAMARHHPGMFHTRLSALINQHRLLPADLVAEVEELDIPLPSKEGFIRQVIGWREFVRHVHNATDGFRALPSEQESPVASEVGDGGWSRWSGKEWKGGDAPAELEGGAAPSLLKSDLPLPPAFWGAKSGLACLDSVVRDVWREGWSHHITRLMILSNFATLLGASPRELTDWFWVAYIDAWDWVVEPNVLGMGTFAVGETMTTKPYVSGAAYISRMSDYCSNCEFDPRRNCPLTAMYWAFLDRNRLTLEGNPRMAMPLRSLAKRSSATRKADEAVRTRVIECLTKGETITPERLP